MWCTRVTVCTDMARMLLRRVFFSFILCCYYVFLVMGAGAYLLVTANTHQFANCMAKPCPFSHTHRVHNADAHKRLGYQADPGLRILSM